MTQPIVPTVATKLLREELARNGQVLLGRQGATDIINRLETLERMVNELQATNERLERLRDTLEQAGWFREGGESLVRDAARWRYVREHGPEQLRATQLGSHDEVWCTGATADEAIDRTIQVASERQP